MTKLDLKAAFITAASRTEAQKVWDEYIANYPLHFNDGNTLVAKGSANPKQWGDGGITTMWAHVIMDLDGDDCFEVDMLGNPPHDQGAFGWDDTSWEDLLECDGYNGHYERTNALQWMLQNGIAPGMRVWIEVEVEWTGGSYWSPDDVDCSYSYRVMWREPWTPKQHVESWEAYLARPSREENQ